MSTRLTTTLLALAIAAHYAPARADNDGQGRPGTFAANCELRKDGDTRKDETGPCTFSHRQGYITLTLRNGDAYSLTPGNEQDQFKDQQGNKVVRIQSGNGFQEFKWEGGKHVIVSFPEKYRQQQYGWQPYYGQSPYGQPVSGQQVAYRIGETPQALAGLIGTNADGTDMQRLGYNWIQGSDNGPGRHGLWYNPNNKHCVRVRIEGDRFQSITETDPRECTNPQANHIGETPQALAHLIGTNADGTDMQRLGYKWIQGSDNGPGRHGLWYNPNNKHCVRVRIEGDRFQSITETDPRECTNPQANHIGETPQALAHLIGTNADGTDMQRLGYKWIQGSDNGPGRHGLWYNPNNKHCVRVRIEGDRYQSITEDNLNECTKR